jgi:hypothetical protein
MDHLQGRVKAGDSVAIAEQGRLQAEHKAKRKQMVGLRLEMQGWEDFREKREEIVIDTISHDRTRKDKAEKRLRDYQTMKEEYAKRPVALLPQPREAAADAAQQAPGHMALGSTTLQQKPKGSAVHVGSGGGGGAALRPSAAELAAGGYCESVEIARARRECWMGHGFKPSSSRGASSVGGSAVGGVVKQQQQTVLQQQQQRQ